MVSKEDFMAVYVMSDLHGNYKGFMSVLEQIQFQKLMNCMLTVTSLIEDEVE